MATAPYQMLPMVFRPGVNREQTQYTAETVGTISANFSIAGGWYASQNVRFRQGFPEKIGGWIPVSTSTFLGVCRSLFNWSSLAGVTLIGVGTNLKFYIARGGGFYDVTPVRQVSTLTNPFTTVNLSTTIKVTDTTNGVTVGDFVTFSGASTFNGVNMNGQFQVTGVVDVNNYTVIATTAANNSGVGGGTVTATYQINVGPAIEIPVTGWGAGTWGFGSWGTGSNIYVSLRLWSQSNFGQDLIFCPRGGGIYYWAYNTNISAPAVNISTLSGASDVPTIANFVFVSDASRFVFAFGTNALGTSTQDPMLVRWSDQESVTMWTPAATNQAGDIRLSRGSQIISCVQNRQEIIVFTDTSVYSFQYIGTPGVWGSNIVGDNISIMSQNAAILAAGVTYWMGIDKFYKYSGTVTTLRCDLREYIFANINQAQSQQIFSGTVEGFNEVWWFYCSGTSTTIDSYVVYNYQDDIWYYGQMARTAWVDSTTLTYPVSASYANTLVYQENGLDDNISGTANAMDSYIQSSEFDVQFGNSFAFINRILPDVTFRKSTAANPQVTMTLIPMQNSGSGYNSPQTTGGTNIATITRTATAPIEQFTGQVFLRVRGRQMIFQIEGNQLGLQWQIGTPRIELKLDGRRGST
jgi:hypothetical protein